MCLLHVFYCPPSFISGLLLFFPASFICRKLLWTFPTSAHYTFIGRQFSRCQIFKFTSSFISLPHDDSSISFEDVSRLPPPSPRPERLRFPFRKGYFLFLKLRLVLNLSANICKYNELWFPSIFSFLKSYCRVLCYEYEKNWIGFIRDYCFVQVENILFRL